MPPTKRISKEAIVDAAVEVLRSGGASAVNARSVAKKLGCSTQPTYLSFQSMNELKTAVTQQAVALHTRHVRDSLRIREDNTTLYSQYSRYSSYGLGFVRFAAQEKHLFRWLYLDGKQPGPRQDDVLLPEIVGGNCGRVRLPCGAGPKAPPGYGVLFLWPGDPGEHRPPEPDGCRAAGIVPQGIHSPRRLLRRVPHTAETSGIRRGKEVGAL